MVNDELEKIWQNSTKAEVIKFDKSDFSKDFNTQIQSFDRILRNRNRREFIAAGIVIVLFGSGAFIFTNVLSKIGMILGTLYGLLVIFMLKTARKNKPTNITLTIKDYLIEYRKYLIKERSLIANVIYWYLLPPFIACFLFFIGQGISTAHLAINMLFIFCLYAFIFYLNKKGVKKSFNPIIEKLGKTISDIEKAE